MSDIQQADGLSFQIFQKAPVSSPVIFTTAYNEYALKAFKLNSIDYLLKHIDATEFDAAFTKFRSAQKPAVTNDQFAELFRQLTDKQNQYKSRFLVRMGDRFITVPIQEVAYIEADDKVVWLHTSGQKYIIDDPLDELTRSLDPVNFFRLNRTYITHLNSIEKIHNHFNGRLKIVLKNCKDDDIFVSRARATEFKQWLSR